MKVCLSIGKLRSDYHIQILVSLRSVVTLHLQWCCFNFLLLLGPVDHSNHSTRPSCPLPLVLCCRISNTRSQLRKCAPLYGWWAHTSHICSNMDSYKLLVELSKCALCSNHLRASNTCKGSFCFVCHQSDGRCQHVSYTSYILLLKTATTGTQAQIHTRMYNVTIMVNGEEWFLLKETEGGGGGFTNIDIYLYINSLSYN